MSEAAEVFNPEFNPGGSEGAVDTNILPWIPVDGVNGMSVKTMRASAETGMFSIIVKLDKGAAMPVAVYLSGMDMFVLSGQLIYRQDADTSILPPGAWGYISANSKVAAIVAEEETEILLNAYGAIAFLDDQHALSRILTSLDIMRMARQHGVALVPSTLSGCVVERQEPLANEPQPLAIAMGNASHLIQASEGAAANVGDFKHPHFVDTREVPWITLEGMETIGLKILRVSEDNGYISLIVRHNGVAPGHTHLGAGDFLILEGRIGVRAGPPEGHGPGVWYFEPPGARHDASQRLSEEDLIYYSNIYGPLVFDEGPGTPVTMVLSWIEYKAMAEAHGAQLVPSIHPNDSSLLASSPLVGRA
ncbi:MAG: hypothetical protein OSA42_06390 [Porticoccaceae bacterium]|nr:hypothetical protein [Porticoccaceae bacterium]